MVSKPLPPDTPIESLSGIGPAYQKRLEKLSILTLRDLLHHYPTRFIDYTKPVSVRDVKDKQNLSLVATLGEPKRFMSKTGKLITEVKAEDDTGKINLIWFNSPYIGRLIVPGEKYVIAGKTGFWGDHFAIIAPIIEPLSKESLHTKGLVPIYPQTKGVNSRFLRHKIKNALTLAQIVDPVPSPTLSSCRLNSYRESLNKIHFPVSPSEHNSADRRLAFNHHLLINLNNQVEIENLPPSIGIKIDQKLHDQIIKNLPFTLTDSQHKAIKSAYTDLEKSTFSHRLIQGETGSGKTVVVVFLAAQALSAKTSFCLLAPTEILANQHYQSFLKFGLPKAQVVLVTGNRPLENVPDTPTVYIGTHALFNQIPDRLPFPISILVIDEQHKFGVKQRDLLTQRNPTPHLFNLTATPIPRTLALGIFGEVAISSLTEKPKNRLPVKTWVVTSTRFQKSDLWLKDQIKSGSKIFVVAPVINESESKSEIESVKTLFSSYQKRFKGFASVFLIHGQMKSEEIEKSLTQFASSKHSILVSTSMIEVGVDIPEADVIIIHSAKNFGLAQLHQLRGRVGRRDRQGYCILIEGDKDEDENERLALMAKYHSGLTLSKMDLKLRGAGELFGIRQHGRFPVRLKHFWNRLLFKKAKVQAIKLLETDRAEALLIAERLANW